eukprot:8542064-Lingulodinium_polyedra.AAC.1
MSRPEVQTGTAAEPHGETWTLSPSAANDGGHDSQFDERLGGAVGLAQDPELAVNACPRCAA